jgi:hypothetical protein
MTTSQTTPGRLVFLATRRTMIPFVDAVLVGPYDAAATGFEDRDDIVTPRAFHVSSEERAWPCRNIGLGGPT